eukprot:1320736-Prymnesium_polylepis.1
MRSTRFERSACAVRVGRGLPRGRCLAVRSSCAVASPSFVGNDSPARGPEATRRAIATARLPDAFRSHRIGLRLRALRSVWTERNPARRDVRIDEGRRRLRPIARAYEIYRVQLCTAAVRRAHDASVVIHGGSGQKAVHGANREARHTT